MQNHQFVYYMERNPYEKLFIATTLTICTAFAAFTACSKPETKSESTALTWIKDNPGERLMPRTLFSDASNSLYASLNMPNGIPASVGTFLMKADGEYALFDAGFGDFGGEMLKRLEQLGVSPDSIKIVYLTHMHTDHIGGLVSGVQQGNPQKVFRNAEIYLGKIERDAWLNEIPNNDLQKAVIAIYSDKLHLFNFNDTLPHGVVALDAVGHTPGHTAFLTGETLVVGDLMHGYALQNDHPEINSNYDMDKPKSAESRKRLMDYAKQNHLTMAGMHLPEPGFVK